MGHQNRYIASGAVHELCFRVREGLPFACICLIELLIKSALARTGRDFKVRISHMVWMGNHVHILIRAHDADQCKKFYMELQKKITDAIKRLLDVDRLILWERRALVAPVLDKEKAIERIIYFYLNPSKAHLVESISEYPGVSSWKEFLLAESSVAAIHSEEIPWIRLPTIKKLKSRVLTVPEDRRLTNELISTATTTHTLTYAPNDWMVAFGISAPEEVNAINQEIQRRVKAGEELLCKERAAQGRSVVGVYNLKRQPILSSHKPKKRERKIFVLSSCPKRRVNYILEIKALFQHCSSLFRKAKIGEIVTWPAGIFPPSIPPLCNALYRQ